jgi:two-component system, sensor histidine kinase ChiS
MNVFRSRRTRRYRGSRCAIIIVSSVLRIASFSPLLHAGENDVEFDHLDIEDGLSQSSVFAIAQDKRGMMWFGTWDGLNSYDGYQFTIYKYDPRNSYSLCSNEVRALYVDRRGLLWIGTMDGLCRFDPEKKRFIRYQHDPNNPFSLAGNKVRAIAEDDNERLWIGTDDGGLSLFERNSEQFFHYRYDPENPESLSNNDVRALFADAQGMLWIGTWGGGLNRFDPDKESFTRYLHVSDDPASVSDNYVRTVFSDEQGSVWVGTQSGGLSRFHRGTQKFTNYLPDSDDPYSISDKEVISIYESRDGKLWIGTRGGGLNLFEQTTGRFKHFQPIDGNNVWSLFEDASGILWIGTSEGGVNRILPDLKNFAHFQHDPDVSTSLSGNDVWSILEDREGELWIGVWDHGLNRFDRQTGEFTQYMPVSGDPFSLSQQDVVEITEDREGALWIGTAEGGLNRFDKQTGRFTRYTHDPDKPQSLPHNNAFTIYEDRQNTLWIGSYYGMSISRFDRDTETFTNYVTGDVGEVNTTGRYRVWSLFEDSYGILWVATDGGGLLQFDREIGRFTTQYAHDPMDFASIGHNSPTVVYEDRRGSLWVATWGGGLNRFNRETQTFVSYRAVDGLPSESIMGILEDDAGAEGEGGNLWLSTFRGISRFNPETERFKNYTPKDGLQGYEFNSTVAFRSRDGRMFFGGINGFTAFYPQEIRDNPYIPPVILTNFQIFNKSAPIGDEYVLKKSIGESNDITLSYRETVFTFEFAALNYQFPEKNRYRYKLDGFEDGWNETDSSRRFATYTHLAPGKYVFGVLGSNNDAIWNESGTTISVFITPPWWRTWWAYTVYILTFVGLLLGFIHVRLRGMVLRQKTLQSIVAKRTSELVEAKDEAEAANRAKSEFLANMSHEIRTPMNAILGFAEILQSRENGPQEARYVNYIRSSGESLLSLINGILDLSKIEAGKLELQYSVLSVASLIEELHVIFDQKIAEKGLDFVVKIDKQLPCALVLDEIRLRQVLLNLMSNAVKFTATGFIRLSVTSKWCHPEIHDRVDLAFTVEDTGIGIAPDAQQTIFDSFVQAHNSKTTKYGGTGLGLTISRRLVDLMGGALSVESLCDGGATFRVELPDVEVEATEAVQPGAEIRPNTKAIRFDPAVILIADDLDYNRVMLSVYLENWPFTIIEAEDGREVLERARRHAPDLILLDMKMPGMDGYQAAELIKQDTKLQGIPVVAITASALKEDEARINRLCDSYLRKPISKGDVTALLMRFLPYTNHTEAVEISASVPDAVQQILTPDAFISIPSDWRDSFLRAVKGADTDACLSLIDSLAPEFGSVASILENMVRNYQFKRLMVLITGQTADDR